MLIFTHFASWGRRLAAHLSEITGIPIACYDGDLTRSAHDRMVAEFQSGRGAWRDGALPEGGGTGLNLTAANHVILYDRWWNPAVEDQARDRAWRIGQTRTVISHRLVCPGTIDERVEEVVQGKRHVAGMILPKSSSVADLNPDQIAQHVQPAARRDAHRGRRMNRNPAQRPGTQRRRQPVKRTPADIWREATLPTSNPSCRRTTRRP